MPRDVGSAKDIISVEKTKKQVEFAKEFVKSMGEYVKAQIEEK